MGGLALRRSTTRGRPLRGRGGPRVTPINHLRQPKGGLRVTPINQLRLAGQAPRNTDQPPAQVHAPISRLSLHEFHKTGQPHRIFGSVAYKATSWDRPRRVIVKAERTAQGR
jgi:hypothetical protein